MPRLGLGVWKTSNNDSRDAVIKAIKHGYRAIDTAREYGNEPGTGEGIREGMKQEGLKREDLFVTTKLYNGEQGDYNKVSKVLDKQLSDLGLDYVDLYLIHWPLMQLIWKVTMLWNVFIKKAKFVPLEFQTLIMTGCPSCWKNPKLFLQSTKWNLIQPNKKKIF